MLRGNPVTAAQERRGAKERREVREATEEARGKVAGRLREEMAERSAQP